MVYHVKTMTTFRAFFTIISSTSSVAIFTLILIYLSFVYGLSIFSIVHESKPTLLQSKKAWYTILIHKYCRPYPPYSQLLSRVPSLQPAAVTCTLPTASCCHVYPPYSQLLSCVPSLQAPAVMCTLPTASCCHVYPPPPTATCCRHVTLVTSRITGSHMMTWKLQFAEEGPTLHVERYELSKTFSLVSNI